MDRNEGAILVGRVAQLSLSARRAWIEISEYRSNSICRCVALRKESVDRNQSSVPLDPVDIRSLSARRAWIEISIYAWASNSWMSLSARRAWIEISAP